MPRFILHRQMALILMLAATLCVCSLAVRAACAAPIDSQGKDGTGEEIPKGDPDEPTGQTRGTRVVGVRHGVQPMVQQQGGSLAVGGGRAPQTVLMWRIRIVLQGLRILNFRF